DNAADALIGRDHDERDLLFPHHDGGLRLGDEFRLLHGGFSRHRADVHLVRWAGRVTVAVVPAPSSLSRAKRPPCISTKAGVRGRPRPVPSNFRLRPLSTWPNGAITLSRSSRRMPMPVSVMATASSSSSVRLSARVIDPPGGVNLTAFDSK